MYPCLDMLRVGVYYRVPYRKVDNFVTKFTTARRTMANIKIYFPETNRRVGEDYQDLLGFVRLHSLINNRLTFLMPKFIKHVCSVIPNRYSQLSFIMIDKSKTMKCFLLPHRK